VQRLSLFNPLEMTLAGFGTPTASGRINQPTGHDELGKPIADPLWMAAYQG
jgi:hypothetical protein